MCRGFEDGGVFFFQLNRRKKKGKLGLRTEIWSIGLDLKLDLRNALVFIYMGWLTAPGKGMGNGNRIAR